MVLRRPLSERRRKPQLEPLFKPRGIAVIGASRSPGKIGHTVVSNLLESGYSGSIYPVNPKADSLLGLEVLSDTSELPAGVDLAIVVVPADSVAEEIEKAGRAGVKHAAIVTSGFSEVGNIAQEREVVETAQDYGMRILGPNVFGIYSSASEMNATFGPAEVPSGNIALVSQSGALGVSLIEKAASEQIGLSTIISLGNRADLTEVEILNYLEDDSATEVIVLYLEGTENGRELLDKFRDITPEKPVIAIKAGRSEKGARAAASHTGSLAGSDQVYSAAFKQSGVLRARSASQAFHWAQMFATQPDPEGREVVILTNGGGVGVMATDACSDEALNLFDDQQILGDLFEDVVPDYGSTRNPVDMTGMATPEEYRRAVKICMDEDQIDAVVVLYCMAAGQSSHDIASEIQEAVTNADGDKPIAVSMLGGTEADEARRWLNDLSVPAYEEPEEAVNALGALYRYERSRPELSRPSPPELDADWETVNDIIEEARSNDRLQLFESEGKRILTCLGIDVAPFKVAYSEDGCVNAAEQIGFPVVLKVESEDIMHKTEAGGVELNLNNPEQVRDAYKGIISSVRKSYPNCEISGISVNKMVEKGLEVVVGSSRDTSFGPTIMFGLGGIYVEVFQDVTFRVAPVDYDEIRQMLAEIKGYPLLLGVRGEGRKDIDQLAEVIYKLSCLVTQVESIVELDINPLTVFEDSNGCLALDCSITVAEVS